MMPFGCVQRGFTALILASYYGHTVAVRAKLAVARVDVNIKCVVSASVVSLLCGMDVLMSVMNCPERKNSS